MKIKGIIDEDFVNYKTPSMVVLFPTCSFKCDKECGKQVCQNSTLATAPNIEVPVADIVQRYLDNPITKSIICLGLEPFDQPLDVFGIGWLLRTSGCKDDIVIYTGYTEEEVKQIPYYIGSQSFPYIDVMKELLTPLVIKYGRYVPDQQPHFDEVLGVNLASDNQYARRYE